jgi:hypothetical protein
MIPEAVEVYVPRFVMAPGARIHPKLLLGNILSTHGLRFVNASNRLGSLMLMVISVLTSMPVEIAGELFVMEKYVSSDEDTVKSICVNVPPPDHAV